MPMPLNAGGQPSCDRHRDQRRDHRADQDGTRGRRERANRGARQPRLVATVGGHRGVAREVEDRRRGDADGRDEGDHATR